MSETAESRYEDLMSLLKARRREQEGENSKTSTKQPSEKVLGALNVERFGGWRGGLHYRIIIFTENRIIVAETGDKTGTFARWTGGAAGMIYEGQRAEKAGEKLLEVSVEARATVLSLTDTSWQALRKIRHSKLLEFIEGFKKIDMEGSDINKVAENIVNVQILSLGRLFKQCILTDDPAVRTILFNVTYDLIKQIFEQAIFNVERDNTIRKKVLEVIESTFKPYAEKYEIDL